MAGRFIKSGSPQKMIALIAKQARFSAATKAPWPGNTQPCVMPQECGLKTDVDWVELSDQAGRTVSVHSSQPFCFSALPCTASELYAGKHAHELTPCKKVILSLDAHHRGVGAESCGPAVLEKYKIQGDRFAFDFTLTF